MIYACKQYRQLLSDQILQGKENYNRVAMNYPCSDKSAVLTKYVLTVNSGPLFLSSSQAPSTESSKPYFRSSSTRKYASEVKNQGNVCSISLINK